MEKEEEKNNNSEKENNFCENANVCPIKEQINQQKNDCCEQEHKEPINKKILKWVKKNFTATVIGIIFSVLGVILSIVFWLIPASDSAGEPFTATIQIYGWKGELHNPLNGKGAIVLTLGDKMEQAPINKNGEAIFKDVLPEHNEKEVPVHITDTEGEPYYLLDNVAKIQRNSITKLQVLLRGLEKLEGMIFDNISGEGLADVSITIAGITAITDANGSYNIDIPIEKQQQEQQVIISKKGYESIRETIAMTGKYNAVMKRN